MAAGDKSDVTVQDQVVSPLLPGLVKVVEGGSAFASNLVDGEVLNVVSGSQDGSMLYFVAWDCRRDEVARMPREGWIPGRAVRLLEGDEKAAVPAGTRLPIREVLKRSTFLQVNQDWSDIHPASMAIMQGEVIQIVTATDGWAFGWPLKAKNAETTVCGRRGWFPLYAAEPVESSMLSVSQAEELSLSIAAVADLVPCLKGLPRPPLRKWSWEGELPAIVAESSSRMQLAWREKFAEEEAENEAAMVKMEAIARGEVVDLETSAGAARAAQPGVPLLTPDDPPEESCKLVVCIRPFTAHKGSALAGMQEMLPLKTGDLVRVVSLMESNMQWWCGYLEGQGAARGWFPRRCVKLFDGYSRSQQGVAPLQQLLQGAVPPLPQVPKTLLTRDVSRR
eukprot:TRINITY_DN49164_c0_g1_i1.p1 TRINITY_DN49164_c0_g1~~TRINITY_DN49164_c0_g1_i1.p1  ORF type:complete len:393 (+),score=78.11 TRINITY_DN49164_c0_g1_i1:40-1218(+)